MTTISIPKNIISGTKLVAIPYKEYEMLLAYKKNKELDEDLLDALKDIKKGRTIGPFSTLASGLKTLKKYK